MLDRCDMGEPKAFPSELLEDVDIDLENLALYSACDGWYLVGEMGCVTEEKPLASFSGITLAERLSMGLLGCLELSDLMGSGGVEIGGAGAGAGAGAGMSVGVGVGVCMGVGDGDTTGLQVSRGGARG